MSRRQSDARIISVKGITTCFLLIPLVFASQQQKRDFRSSIREDGASNSLQDDGNRARLLNQNTDSNDASAIATLAPAAGKDTATVRAPSPVQEFALRGSGSTTKAGGLSTLINARSLQDWEVEDFILLATVDGSIHARDRRTGQERWNLEVDRPLVESTYHRENNSGIQRPEDDFLWIIEPSKDGDIYIYDKSGKYGLQKPQLTIKKLAEDFSPSYSEDSAVVYATEKKTTLYAVDAATGTITRTFSSGGPTKNDGKCRRINQLDGQDDKCGSNGSIMLGRTEYTINIAHVFGDPICTLKYSEWGPNTRDLDLQSQYHSTLDNRYVVPRHDGRVLGIELSGLDSPNPDLTTKYNTKLPSPAVRIFDVARPAGSQGQDTQLVLLPQPAIPALDTDTRNRDNIFVNKTEAGGWFAMSEATYPYSTGGAKKVSSGNVNQFYLSREEQEREMVGVHSLSSTYSEQARQILTISPPPVKEIAQDSGNTTPLESTAQGITGTDGIKQIGYGLLSGYVDSPMSGVFAILAFLLLFGALISDSKTVNRWFRSIRKQNIVGQVVAPQTEPIAPEPLSPVTADIFDDLKIPLPASPVTLETSSGESTPLATKTALLEPPRSRSSTIEEDRGRAKDGPRVRIIEPSPSPGRSNLDDDVTDTPTATKKKARRGCRGGAKHKKKKGKEGDAAKEVDEVVEEALQIANTPTTLEPDVIEVKTTSPTDVSGPIMQIGHLRVFTDTTLGFGSHGTVVYKGTFQHRDVAVKRMLLEFYDIASHEVEVLSVSDNHHNVIRYYHQEAAGQFLYIALELCPASLQDLVEKPQDYSELLGPSGLDPPNILKQITDGLRHLHSLKIVHRDLKPQNILVSTPQKLAINTGQFQPPRILISDFGLCKKLEGDQSSFRATTAHAAGTSGWRAPELLVDDDPLATNTNGMSNSSLPPSTTSDSEPLILDSQTNRRATRAIDIFSLGCVFYFVLTGGSHPFDRDGRYMREANVVKGHYSLEELARLGDYQWEARDLIASMIHNNPKARPDAATILRHPFFWLPKDRLDFLCGVSDAFEFEPRDPPSPALQALEALAPILLKECHHDFLRALPQAFKDTLGKQRKYVGSRMLDLLRAMRNKRSHYEDMPDNVKKMTGPLPAGYLGFWTRRFPGLLLESHKLVKDLGWHKRDRFVAYYSDQ